MLIMERIIYDEFSFFHENIAEWSLDVPPPIVSRFFVSIDGLRQLSGLRWGEGPAQLSLLHGGAQNAHTWDTVALALSRPLVAIDLPGHGHSDAGPFGHGAISSHAHSVAVALEQLIEGPRPLVGMSLGGMTAMLLAKERPDLVSKLLLVDITPGVNRDKASHITNFVNGPKYFDDFDALLARTVEHNPTRSVSSLRRGILHNALQRDDGTWVWRHQQHEASTLESPNVENLWDVLEQLPQPVTLVRGMAKGSVVDDEDEAEFKKRRPKDVVVHVEGAGHSIQGDEPVLLAGVIEEYLLEN
jgi:pimeloyl-ACP methyl ester carboxylesterase